MVSLPDLPGSVSFSHLLHLSAYILLNFMCRALSSVALVISKAVWRLYIDSVAFPSVKILISFLSSKKNGYFFHQKTLRKDGERHLFPRRDAECTAVRNQKHRGRKISRSCLTSLQRVSELCSCFVSLPTDPFQSLMMQREKLHCFKDFCPLMKNTFTLCN